MKKNHRLEKIYMKKEQGSTNLKKQKNLFDHLTAIRTTKDPNYYNSLTDGEKKGFNHWILLHALSMDTNLIELASFLWRDGYYDAIPSNRFYQLLLEIIPKTNQKLNWIKKSKKPNNQLIKYVSEWYSISTREAKEYVDIYSFDDKGILELASILEGIGLSAKEVENVLMREGD